MEGAAIFSFEHIRQRPGSFLIDVFVLRVYTNNVTLGCISIFIATFLVILNRRFSHKYTRYKTGDKFFDESVIHEPILAPFKNRAIGYC